MNKKRLLLIWATISFACLAIGIPWFFLYETIVFEGKPAYYSGELPKRELEGVEEGTESDFEYKFTGWDQDLTAVYSNITTRATFEYGPKEDWGPMTRF